MKRAREEDQDPRPTKMAIFRSYSDEFETYYVRRAKIQEREDAELFSARSVDTALRVAMLIENVRLIVDQQSHPMMMEHYDWLNSLVAGSLKQLYNKDRATIVELLWQYNIEQEFDLHLWVCPRRFGKTFSTCIFLAAFAPLLHNDPINFIAQQMSNAQLAVVTFRTHLETLYRVRGYDFVILREDAEKGFAFLNFDGVAKYGNKLTEKQRKALITQDPNSCCVINIMTTTTTVSYFLFLFNSASLR